MARIMARKVTKEEYWAQTEKNFLKNVDDTAKAFGLEMERYYKDYMHKLWFGDPDAKNPFPGIADLVDGLEEEEGGEQ